MRPFALVVCVLACATHASAAPILFNLEDQTQTPGNSFSSGDRTSITSTQSGLTITVSRADGTSFTMNDLTGFGSPASWLSRSLGNFASSFGAGATIVVNFSQPVSQSSIQFGDYGADDDGTVTMNAFSGLNGSGSLLGTSSVAYPINLNIGNGDADVRSLSVSAGGIQSFTVSSSGGLPGSLFFDNISATPAVAPTPEPATLAVFGMLFAVSGCYGWRRNRANGRANCPALGA